MEVGFPHGPDCTSSVALLRARGGELRGGKDGGRVMEGLLRDIVRLRITFLA